MSLPYHYPPARPLIDPPDPYNNTTAYTYPHPLQIKKGSRRLSKAFSATARNESEHARHDAIASQDVTSTKKDQVSVLLLKFLLDLPGSSIFGLGTAGTGWEFPLF